MVMFGKWDDRLRQFLLQGDIEHSDELKLGDSSSPNDGKILRLTLWHDEIYLSPHKARQLAEGLLEWAGSE